MISVIITTYKRNPKILERAVNSVINQTYRNWELYIIDDSPNDYKERDNVKKMINKYKNNKIHYLQQPKNLGACKARNRGIKLAKGEYIAFLDDDDVWKSNKLEIQLKKMEELDNNYALVYCGSTFYNQKTNKYKKHKTIFKSGYVFDELITNNFIGGSSFPLIKTKIIKELGGFDERLLACQDLDMWLRVAEKYFIDYVEEPLVIYYLHDGEQISTNPTKRIQGTRIKMEKYKDYLENHPQKYSLCLLECAYSEALNKELKKSIITWWESIKKGKLSFTNIIVSFARIIKIYLVG